MIRPLNKNIHVFRPYGPARRRGKRYISTLLLLCLFLELPSSRKRSSHNASSAYLCSFDLPEEYVGGLQVTVDAHSRCRNLTQ